MNRHYFIGIRVGVEVKEALVKWQTMLKNYMEYKVWTHKDDLHITLKFLGGCSDEKIEAYIDLLRAETWPPDFKLTVGPAGSFGEKKRPRVFYAAVEEAAPLLRIKSRVEDMATKIGFEKEKRSYRPHITLAKKGAEGESPILFTEENHIFSEQYKMPISEICVFTIHPGETPRYKNIATIQLDKKG